MRRTMLVLAGLAVTALVGCGQTALGDLTGKTQSLSNVSTMGIDGGWTVVNEFTTDPFAVKPFPHPCDPTVTINLTQQVHFTWYRMFLANGHALDRVLYEHSGTATDTAGFTYDFSGKEYLTALEREPSQFGNPAVQPAHYNAAYHSPDGGQDFKEHLNYNIVFGPDGELVVEHGLYTMVCNGGKNAPQDRYRGP